MKDTVVINDKNVEVEVTAYTMLIYEDTFKGHGFLRDADRILVKNLNDVKFGSYGQRQRRQTIQFPTLRLGRKKSALRTLFRRQTQSSISLLTALKATAQK
mgnify:CR=1 FL=1